MSKLTEQKSRTSSGKLTNRETALVDISQQLKLNTTTPLMLSRIPEAEFLQGPCYDTK